MHNASVILEIRLTSCFLLQIIPFGVYNDFARTFGWGPGKYDAALLKDIDALVQPYLVPTGVWQAGTGTTESLVSPAKVKAVVDAFALNETARDVTGDAGYLTLSNGFIFQWDNWNYSHGYRSFPITYPNACLGFSYTQRSGWYENWHGYKVSNSQYYTANIYVGTNASRATYQAMFSIGY